jgi:SAM-dependent methyltransferase
VITGPDNLFALPEVEALLREELARVPALAARQPGGRALLLQAAPANRALPADLRHLGVTRMHVDRAAIAGDVVCAADALPWEDEAFHFVVVQHAGDALAHPDGLVDELARVLVPGGSLVWFGLNPLSPWILWLSWQARQGRPLPRATQADSVRRRLLQGKLTPATVESIGPCWPNRDAQTPRSSLLAPLRGAWMLVASKQRATLTPLHRRPLRRVTPQPSLAVPSRRVRA